MDVLVFISYSSDDKKLAGQLKTRLDELGIAAFLAHDDIPGGSKWEDAIREKIRDCRLFLALVTKTYHEHEFTDQELGMAAFAERPIVCIAVDGERPRGFASSYQHIQYDTSKTNMEYLGRSILNAALLVATDRADRVNFVVKHLASTKHFDDSNILARHLDENARLSGSQARLLAQAFVKNDQVHYALHLAGKRVLSILIGHLRLLDPETAAEIKGIVSKIDQYREQMKELQMEEEYLAQSYEDDLADAEMDRMRTFSAMSEELDKK